MEPLPEHSQFAKSLLEKQGVSLANPTAEQSDPQLANAQAATHALGVQAAQKILPAPSAEEIYADGQRGNPDAEKAAFLAQSAKAVDVQHMAKQQLAAQEAAETGPPIPQRAPSQIPGMPGDIIAGPADLTVAAAKLRDRGLAYAQQDSAAAKKVLKDTAAVDAEQAAAEKPHIDALATQSEESMARLQDFNTKANEQMDAKMAHFQTVQTEMETMAKEQPKDLLGQAGVNSLLGNIAIFLGGAGVNGFHENKNLQMLQSMADRNVAAQRNRFEMLQRVGQGDQTMYGMLMQKLQSKTAAEAALRSGYFDTYKAHLAQVGNQYSDKRAKLRVEAGVAQADQLKHEAMQKVQSEYQNTAVQATQLMDQQVMQQLQANAQQQAVDIQRYKVAADLEKEQHERAEKTKETSLLGVIGTTSKEEHAKLSEMWGGAYNMVSNLDEAQKIMNSGANFASGRAYIALKNINLGESKKYFNTGARLEPKEVSMMEAVGLSNWMYTERLMIDGGVGLTGTQIAEGLKGIQWLIAHDSFTTLKAGNPHLQVDPKDPIMGRFFYGKDATPQWQTDYTKRHGTEAGRDALKKAPVYTDTYTSGMGATW